MSDDKKRATIQRTDEPQIRAGQAHLFELAALNARQGQSDEAHKIACSALGMDEGFPNSAYREGLRVAGLKTEAIDAAVASILDGKHPADSLAGRLLKMRENANDAMSTSDARGYLTARVHMAIDVLDMIADCVMAGMARTGFVGMTAQSKLTHA